MSSEIELQSNSHLFGSNAPYVEELYESWLENPGSISDYWRNYFDQLQHQPATDGLETTRDQAHAPSLPPLPCGRATMRSWCARKRWT